MNYADKIQYSESVKARLLQGNSLESLTPLATEFDIVPYQLEKVIDLAKRELYNDQQPDIQAYLLNDDKFPPDSDWLKLDDSVQDALLELGKKDLVQDEIDNVQSLLQENYSQEEILNEVRLNIYPIEHAIRQIEKYKAAEERRKKNKSYNLIGGILLLGLDLVLMVHYNRIPIVGIVVSFVLIYRGSKKDKPL